jgi:hypothetical protein
VKSCKALERFHGLELTLSKEVSARMQTSAKLVVLLLWVFMIKVVRMSGTYWHLMDILVFRSCQLDRFEIMQCMVGETLAKCEIISKCMLGGALCVGPFGVFLSSFLPHEKDRITNLVTHTVMLYGHRLMVLFDSQAHHA